MKFSGFIFAAEDCNTHEKRYDFLMSVARYLDQNDFAALWTPERHFQEFGGCFPNPAVLSAALAAITEQLHLRAGSVVAPHHHAVRIAEEWALVDQIAKGRTGICFATGWHARDFIFYPENYPNRKRITYEKIQQIEKLLAGEPYTFSAYKEDVEVTTYPRPYQKNIPMWLVFSSDPNIWIKAGELGLNVLSLLNGWEIIEENIVKYRQAREQHGHDPATGIVTIGVHTYIGDNNEQVQKLVEKPLKAYLGSFLLAKNDDKRLSSGQAPMTESEKEMILNAAFYDLVDSRGLLGDLDKCKTVTDRLQDIGVDEVAALIDFGVDFDLVLKSLDKLTVLKNMYTETTSTQQPAMESANKPEDTDFNWYFNR